MRLIGLTPENQDGVAVAAWSGRRDGRARGLDISVLRGDYESRAKKELVSLLEAVGNP